MLDSSKSNKSNPVSDKSVFIVLCVTDNKLTAFDFWKKDWNGTYLMYTSLYNCIMYSIIIFHKWYGSFSSEWWNYIIYWFISNVHFLSLFILLFLLLRNIEHLSDTWFFSMWLSMISLNDISFYIWRCAFICQIFECILVNLGLANLRYPLPSFDTSHKLIIGPKNFIIWGIFNKERKL